MILQVLIYLSLLQVLFRFSINIHMLFVHAFRPPSLSDEIGCSPTLTIFRNIMLPTSKYGHDNESSNMIGTNSMSGSSISSSSIGIGSSSGSGSGSTIGNSMSSGSTIVNPISKRRFWKQQVIQESLYYFDPFQLANDENFAKYREAELKHGRVCMLAMFEYITVPWLKRLNVIPIGINDNNDEVIFTTIMPTSFPEGIMNSILHTTTEIDYVTFVLTCGILETFVLIQRNPNDLPGDYNIGYFGIRNYGLHEKEFLYELEHGRLSMIAFIIACLLEIVNQGESWTEQWISFLKHWVEQL